ncbi:MAG: DUF302 domain-containing protein [Candidatus Cloacimonetes bacterium]|jgi:uncharacterized protein (DUF302 family)|nr:DUF302 domain-containing protein [Candidatus Cloacimonadota bacterium]
MKKLIIGLIIGMLAGFLICGVVVWKTMPQMMLTVKKSNYDFEETFSRIENSILDHDWDIQRIYDMQECMESYGYENIKNISIFSLCKPENVAVILADDKNKKVTAIMPCRMGVYETSNGEVYVSRLNIALMSKMFGGVIEEVMSGVAKDEADILEGIIKE